MQDQPITFVTFNLHAGGRVVVSIAGENNLTTVERMSLATAMFENGREAIRSEFGTYPEESESIKRATKMMDIAITIHEVTRSQMPWWKKMFTKKLKVKL